MSLVQTDAADRTSVSLEGEADTWLGAMSLSLVSITLFTADQQLVHLIVGKVHASSSGIAGRLSMQFQTLLRGGGEGRISLAASPHFVLPHEMTKWGLAARLGRTVRICINGISQLGG